MLRFNQTLENNLKVSVGNDTYNLTNKGKIHLIYLTESRSPNVGSDLLPKWRTNCIKKIMEPRLVIF